MSEPPDFRKMGSHSSGTHSSESVAPREIMRNRIDKIFWSQTCKNKPLFQFEGPRFLEAPDLWVCYGKRFFSTQKRAPYFWKPLTCGYVAAGAFFFNKKSPIFLEAPDLWVHCRRHFFSEKMGTIFLEAPNLGRAHKKKIFWGL